MRRLALATLVALAFPVSAQTTFSDTAGVYVALHGVRIGTGANPYLGSVIDATVGYRFNAHADAGLRVRMQRGLGYAVGPTGGVTQPLPGGLRLRLDAGADYASSEMTRFNREIGDFDRLAAQTLTTDASATVSRPLRLVGTVRVAPGLGVYGTAGRYLAYDGYEGFPTPRTAFTSAGVQIEMPLSFRLLGRSVAFAPGVRWSLVGQPLGDPITSTGAVARVNF